MATPQQQLHKAVRANHMETVTSLLNSGVGINAVFYGWTPLQLAIENGLEEMAVFLLTKGCNASQHDQHTKPPFEEAMMKKQPKVVEALINAGESPNYNMTTNDSALCFAIELGCFDLVKVLLHGGANPNSENKRGDSAVYIASQEGETEMLKELIKKGADVNKVHKDNNNYTPLIAAAAGDNEDIVHILIQNKAEVDHQDGDGWTALWHAYSNSNEEITELLLKAGAKTDLANNDGKTVVQEANENEDEDFIALFNKFKIV